MYRIYFEFIVDEKNCVWKHRSRCPSLYIRCMLQWCALQLHRTGQASGADLWRRSIFWTVLLYGSEQWSALFQQIADMILHLNVWIDGIAWYGMCIPHTLPSIPRLQEPGIECFNSDKTLCSRLITSVVHFPQVSEDNAWWVVELNAAHCLVTRAKKLKY